MEYLYHRDEAIQSRAIHDMKGIPVSLILLGIVIFAAVLHCTEADLQDVGEFGGTVEAGDDAIDSRMKRQAEREEGGGPGRRQGRRSGKSCGGGRGGGRRGGSRNSTTSTTTETAIR